MGRKAGNDIMERKMNSLPPGAGGTVCRVEGGGLMRRRLLELGFLPGARVVCRLSRSPGGRPPTRYGARWWLSVRKTRPLWWCRRTPLQKVFKKQKHNYPRYAENTGDDGVEQLSSR